jgi:hypothetical protein
MTDLIGALRRMWRIGQATSAGESAAVHYPAYQIWFFLAVGLCL